MVQEHVDWCVKLLARDGYVIGNGADIYPVSVMDGIMFEAQRQGRLSFYMVSDFT